MHTTANFLASLLAVSLAAGNAALSDPLQITVSPGPGSLSSAVLEALVSGAVAVQQADLEAWHGFRFHRRVVREKLGADGEVTRREVLEFQLTPVAEGFDEELVAMDGEPPRESDVRKHREEARFTRRYHQALGEGENGEETQASDASAYGVRVPLAGRRFLHRGQEVVDGVRCHRLELLEEEPPAGAGAYERVGAATVGTLWIGVDRLQVVRADLRAAHPVRFAAGLARLVSLEVLMETAPVPGGARLPASIEVRTEVSILGVNLRRHNHFAYTTFEPAPGAHIIPQACP